MYSHDTCPTTFDIDAVACCKLGLATAQRLCVSATLYNDLSKDIYCCFLSLLQSPEPMHQYDSPPSYDSATKDGASKPPMEDDVKQSQEQQLTPSMQSQPYAIAGPSYTYTPHSLDPGPTLYHYVNPLTQEHVASLLPPDHPEMLCLQSGRHVPETKFGILGILAAVFWFPLGVGLCLLDRRVKCGRCGHIIDDGICG